MASKKIKFLGATGTQELINLLKADMRLKQDLLQFSEMPQPALYVGRVVQYVGKTNEKFTHGHFYKSSGYVWQEVYSSLSGKTWQLVDTLPPIADAEYDVLYFTANQYRELSGYVRGDEQYYELGTTREWVVVGTLPVWADARSDVIYFVVENNVLRGYVKDDDNADSFFELGGKVNYNEIDNTPTINGISTKNEEDKDAPKDVILNAVVKKYGDDGTYDEDGTDVPVNEMELHAFKDEEIAEMFGA